MFYINHFIIIIFYEDPYGTVSQSSVFLCRLSFVNYKHCICIIVKIFIKWKKMVTEKKWNLATSAGTENWRSRILFEMCLHTFNIGWILVLYTYFIFLSTGCRGMMPLKLTCNVLDHSINVDHNNDHQFFSIKSVANLPADRES